MGAYDCYYDPNGCLVCPERPAQPYVPTTVEQENLLGWNAGANSIDTVDGSLHAVFGMPLRVVGVVIGLKGARTRQTVPSLIEHGFYFQQAGTLDVFQVIEMGTTRTVPMDRADGDIFEIRRMSGSVRYLYNNDVLYVSTLASFGSKIVNACLYSSYDTVPSR